MLLIQKKSNKKDMSIMGIIESVTLDRMEWWKRIHVASPD